MQIPLLLLPHQVQAPLPEDPTVQSVREMDVPVELLRHDERSHLLPALINDDRYVERFIDNSHTSS